MRFPLALLLVAALLAAGCATPDVATDAADANATVPEAGEPPVDEGTRPMEADVGHMPHMHDYWAGKERVTLFDGAVDPTANDDPFTPLYGIPAGQVGGHVWRLPDGAVVMEGTGLMDLTASWDDPLVTSLAVAYRVGAGEWSAPIPLASGERASIAITPEMTDLPHMTTSRWAFAFAPSESPGALMGPFDLKVEIVKLRDIMLFPGHPELFEGRPEKALHDREHAHEEASYAKRAPNVVTRGEFGEKTVVPDEIVPLETKAMRVEVTVIESGAEPGEVAEIRFFYRGADTTYLGHPTVLPLEGSFESGFLVYQFPVRAEQTDSPYANESQWLFFVEPATKFTGQDAEPTAGGMTDVSIRYHLRIVAYDHELDAYSKMEDEE